MPLTPLTEVITFFYTRDMQATRHFYETLLGLETVIDQDDCRIWKIGADGYLGFCERVAAPEKPEGVIFTFVTEDVDAWANKLRANGVPFDKEPALTEKYGIYNCFLRDPNGYLIEIQRFLDPDWKAVIG